MKSSLRRWIALAGAALILATVVAAAFAANETQDGKPFNNIIYRDGVPYRTESVLIPLLVGGVLRSDSTSRAITVDASGNVSFVDASPDRNQLYKLQGTTQTTLWTPILTAGKPAADSSAALNTLGWKHMAIALTYTLDDSISAAVFAIQIRGHYTSSSDSVSRYGWQGATLRSAVGSDTLGPGISTRTGLVQSGQAAWDTLAAQNEQVIVLDNSGNSRNRWILLTGSNGEWFSAPFTSIRLRYLNSYNATYAAYGKDPTVNIQMDLVGWR